MFTRSLRKTMKKLVLLIALFWAIANALFALEPHLEVTALDSVAIPYEYDYVMQLPNGDLQFYKLNYGTSSIQFYGFQFLAQTNEVTPQVDIGTASGLHNLSPYERYFVQRYGKQYMVYCYPSAINAEGLAVITLNQNTLIYRIIDEFALGYFYDYHRLTNVVSDDAIALALPDSLVYYDLDSGNRNSIMNFEGDPQRSPIVISLPNEYFVYVNDNTAGFGSPEVWDLFYSNGDHLSTQICSYPYFASTTLTNNYGTDPSEVFGRWYIDSPQIIYNDGCLECSFAEPDSLHLYFFTSPNPEYQLGGKFYPFGNDRILRVHNNSVYCNYSPIELFPNVMYSFNFGGYYPSIATISAEITTMSVCLPDSIAVLALWTNDFPVVHEFYFPASTNASTVCTTFTYNNNLRLLNNHKIYSYHVAVSSEVADEVNSCAAVEMQAYPNPVRSGEQLTISSNTKQPLMLDIYNIKGQKMRSLAMDKSGKISWDLLGDDGAAVASGIYILKPRNASSSKPTKIIILK